MIRAARLVAALLLLAAALPAAAQDVAALSSLTGSWRGPGMVRGNASEAALEIRPVLGGRLIELSYRVGSFEGRAFYRPGGEGRWRGTWFDSHGASFPIEARLEGRVLTADWGATLAERSRTIYRLTEDGTLEIGDSVTLADGSRRDFASHRLRRAP
jgi:hypothetical protein